jgi:hypothetical protein
MWQEVKGKIDEAFQILTAVMEESGEPYPADVYLLWNDLAFMRYQLDAKIDRSKPPPFLPNPGRTSTLTKLG